MISPSATNPDISTLGAYIWRICMTDAVQGEGLAKYSVDTLGKQKIAIMYDNSDYGRGPRRRLRRAASRPPEARSWARSSTPPATPTSRPSSPS